MFLPRFQIPYNTSYCFINHIPILPKIIINPCLQYSFQPLLCHSNPECLYRSQFGRCIQILSINHNISSNTLRQSNLYDLNKYPSTDRQYPSTSSNQNTWKITTYVLIAVLVSIFILLLFILFAAILLIWTNYGFILLTQFHQWLNTFYLFSSPSPIITNTYLPNILPYYEIHTPIIAQSIPTTIIQQPIIQQPIIQQPIIQQPIIQQPIIEHTIIEHTIIEQPIIEHTIIEQPITIVNDIPSICQNPPWPPVMPPPLTSSLQQPINNTFNQLPLFDCYQHLRLPNIPIDHHQFINVIA